MKAVNIKWDIDGENNILLPKEIKIPNNIKDDEEISDYISNITGYCHLGFDLINEDYE